jgi:hypothetical protein
MLAWHDSAKIRAINTMQEFKGLLRLTILVAAVDLYDIESSDVLNLYPLDRAYLISMQFFSTKYLVSIVHRWLSSVLSRL